MKKMIDIHMHLIPDVDDGSDSLEMSKEMLLSAIEQGIEAVIATPHNYAFEEYTEYTRIQYRRLQKLIREENLPIRVYLGSEVLYDIEELDALLKNLASGRIPSLNDTQYVLVEVYREISPDILRDLKQLIEHNWIPIIAHIEKVRDLSIEQIRELKAAGCLLQINAFSIAEDTNERVKEKAKALLDNRLVDFIGSDAHRIDHRPPAVAKGIQYLYEHYEESYVDDYVIPSAVCCAFQEHQGRYQV